MAEKTMRKKKAVINNVFLIIAYFFTQFLCDVN